MEPISSLLPDASRALALLGGALSGLAFLLLVVLCRDCRRRSSRFRPVRPTGPTGPSLSPTWVGTGWLLLLLGSFLLGLRGLPLVSTERSLPRTRAAADPAAAPAAAPARSIVTSLRLPFWVRTVRREETAAGRRLAGSVRDALQLPWSFLLAAALYGLLGVRPSRGWRAAAGSSERPEGERRASRSSRAGLAVLLLVAGAWIVLPAPRNAAASGCGGVNGPLCYVYTKCKRILIIKKCTTEYAYFPEYV